jgi:hypothetical protein
MTDESLLDETIDPKDRDSIHTMSLLALPINHPGLRRTRLVKNVRMETRIEMFSGDGVGSGQIAIESIPDHFPGDAALRADMSVLSNLAILPSFDCYTLRRGLRQQGINVEQEAVFKLSDSKIQELFPLMRRITRPLIKHLYGEEDLDVTDTRTLLELVKNPDQDKVMDRLDRMATTLGVSVAKLPTFLEDFGDLYLSLSYFESYFLEHGPKVEQMILWAKDVGQSSHLRNDPSAQKTLTDVERRIRYLKDNLENRFKNLSEVTKVNWDLLDVSMFQKVQRSILAEQIYLATGLCGLAVKIYEWERVFPNAGGSPDRVLEFISSELRPGLDNLVRTMPKVEVVATRSNRATSRSARGAAEKVWG